MPTLLDQVQTNSDAVRSGVYVVEQISGTQSLTKEGFLLCAGVPISRTGELLYGPGEIKVRGDELAPQVGGDGLIHIMRNAEDVFAAESIASFAGKPLVNDHPVLNGEKVWVTPDTYKNFACGVVLNPRRGTGEFGNCVVADLLVTDKDTIEDVRNGKREVSCGYGFSLEDVVPGRATQRNIVGNHVALVERGRCGPTCKIGDHEMSKPSLKDKLLALLTAQTGDEEGGLHIHMGGEKADAKDDEEDKFKKFDERFEKLEGSVSKLADAMSSFAKAKDDEQDPGDPAAKQDVADDEEEKDEKKKAEASDSFRQIASRAEILAPGVSLQMPKVTKTFDKALCGCKRQVLAKAFATDDGRAALEPFVGKQPAFDALPETLVDAAFTGGAELMRARRAPAKISVGITGSRKGPPSPEQLNKSNREFWAKNGG